MGKKNCKKCGAVFISKRNPNQSYCNKVSCQNARKNSWRMYKRLEDSDYQENHRISNNKWRKRKPSYWREYREAHPDYTELNRKQCRRRKQQKRLLSSGVETVSQFAKSDALLDKNILKSGTYSLIPVHAHQFAKSDALTVKISLIT